MGGYAVKEPQNQSGQSAEDLFKQYEDAPVYTGEDLTPPAEGEIAEYIEVETPFGGIKVDTGNTNIDIAIFAVGALLIFMFIYGKFFREKKKQGTENAS